MGTSYLEQIKGRDLTEIPNFELEQIFRNATKIGDLIIRDICCRTSNDPFAFNRQTEYNVIYSFFQHPDETYHSYAKTLDGLIKEIGETYFHFYGAPANTQVEDFIQDIMNTFKTKCCITDIEDYKKFLEGLNKLAQLGLERIEK